MKKTILHIVLLLILSMLVILAGCNTSVSGTAIGANTGNSNITFNVDLQATSLPLDANTSNVEQGTAGEQSYNEASASPIEGVDTAAEINAVTDSAPAVSTILIPEASDEIVYDNRKATIDASNSEDGYVMIKYTGSVKTKIKALIDTPTGIRYIYNLNSSGDYEVFPLTDGDGTYTIGVYENISGCKYATAYSTRIKICLKDQFSPFLRPNQYVNFNQDSQVVVKANELCQGETAELDKITSIYNYVVTNFTYDKQLAATVKSGYLPVLDTVLANKKGICFDYAALMTGMLRSQGIPTKLVIGYSGSAYHAWINTYVKGQGWVNGVIHFDGEKWELMDPTYASTAKSSTSIMQYINDSRNYVAKYLY
jgi:transglutaminase-like putative cysteine protease